MCTRQELCLSDDTTTRFGFFTIDVDVDVDIDVDGSQRTQCDDNLTRKRAMELARAGLAQGREVTR